MEQLLYGWCSQEESPTGRVGLHIQAVSPGLNARDADDLTRNYCLFKSGSLPGVPGQRRLALFRGDQGAVVVHTYFFSNKEKRPTYFTHLLAGLPPNEDALAIMQSWKSSAWILGCSPGCSRVLKPCASPPGPGPLTGFVVSKLCKEDGAIKNLQFLVSAVLRRSPGSSIAVLGKEDEVAATLYFVFEHLPMSARRSLEFTTLDEPTGAPPQAIVGFTRAPNDTRTLQSFLGRGVTAALDLDGGLTCGEGGASAYGNWLVNALRSERTAQIKDLLERYDAAGLQSLCDLDKLIALEETRQRDPGGLESLLAHIASPGLAAYYLQDRTTVDSVVISLVKDPSAIASLGDAIRQISPTPTTLDQFVASLGKSLYGRVERGKSTEECEKPILALLQKLNQTADKLWTELFDCCSRGGGFPPACTPAMRVWLLEKWQDVHEIKTRGDFVRLAETGANARPEDLAVVLRSKLPDVLKDIACRAAVRNASGCAHFPEECWKLLAQAPRLAKAAFAELVAQPWFKQDTSKQVPAGLAGLSLPVASSLGWSDCRHQDLLQAALELLDGSAPKATRRRLTDLSVIADFLQNVQPATSSFPGVLKILIAAQGGVLDASEGLMDIAQDVAKRIVSVADWTAFADNFSGLCGALAKDADSTADDCFKMMRDSPEAGGRFDLVLGLFALCSALGASREPPARQGMHSLSMESITEFLYATRGSSLPPSLVCLLAEHLHVEALLPKQNELWNLLRWADEWLDERARKRLGHIEVLRGLLNEEGQAQLDGIGFSRVFLACEALDADVPVPLGSRVVRHCLRASIATGQVPDFLNSLFGKPTDLRRRRARLDCLMSDAIELPCPRNEPPELATFICALLLGGIEDRLAPIADLGPVLIHRLQEVQEKMPRGIQTDIDKAVRRLPRAAQEAWGLPREGWLKSALRLKR